MALVDIILINYNGADDTIECIESLWKMNFQDFRIIVIENGSTDNSVSQLSAFISLHDGVVEKVGTDDEPKSETRLIGLISEVNKGFAAGNNIGIHYSMASSESGYIWLLNNDTTVDPQALHELVNAYSHRKACPEDNPGILGSKILLYHNRNQIQALGGHFNPYRVKVKLTGMLEKDEGQYDQPIENLDMVLGASMFVDKEFVRKVGMLNEKYFLYNEELDWSYRAKQQGLNTICQTSSIVYHKQGASTKNKLRGSKSEFAMYHMFASLIKFYQAYYPRLILRARLIILMKLVRMKMKKELPFWRLFYKLFLKR